MRNRGINTRPDLIIKSLSWRMNIKLDAEKEMGPQGKYRSQEAHDKEGGNKIKPR